MELALERRPHLDVAAEAHDEQDRSTLAGHRDPQEVPVHAGERAQAVHSEVHVASGRRIERPVGRVAGASPAGTRGS